MLIIKRVAARYAVAVNIATPSLQHLQAKREGLAAVCRRHRVCRLAVFGSMARGEGGAGSDYDFPVKFNALPPGGYAMAFFGLQEDLQALLGASVELVELVVERAATRTSASQYKRSARSCMRFETASLDVVYGGLRLKLPMVQVSTQVNARLIPSAFLKKFRP